MTSVIREVTGDAVRASWMARLKRGSRVAVAAAIAAVFLALVGAFGAGASLGFRLAYWLGVILIATAMAYGVSAVVCRFIDGKTRPWLAGSVVTVILAALVTGLLAAFWGLVFEAPVRWGMLPGLYAQVLIVTAAMTAFITAVEHWPGKAQTPSVEELSPSRFMERLPHRLRDAELLAVSAEDHYLRVHTDRGEAMILLRLADAAAELVGVDGARTHRSWWVARSGIADVERRDQRVVLVLKTGARASVSRSQIQALRRRGWL